MLIGNTIKLWFLSFSTYSIYIVFHCYLHEFMYPKLYIYIYKQLHLLISIDIYKYIVDS